MSTQFNPFSTIQSIRQLIESRELSAREVIEHFSKRAHALNPELNAFLEIYDIPDEVVTQGPLAGIPGAMKANMAQRGRITSCGSRMLESYRPTYDATIKRSLEASGAFVMGSANMDEFAMGSTGQFSAFGPTKNPWNINHSPGGSSSGSAAAVAGGLALWAIGTETGGSIRQPAGFCSLVGLYPTYGLFSRYGLIAFGSSLDQPGPITHSVYDNALVASCMSGHDPKDSTSLPEPRKDFTRELDGKMPENLTIGIIKDSLEAEGIDDEVRSVFRRATEELERMGAKIKVIDLPNMKHGIPLFFVISRAETASNLSRFDGTLYGSRDLDSQSLQEMMTNTRTKSFGIEIKRRIITGNYVLASGHRGFYERANQIRRMIRADFEDAFNDVDLLVSPTAPNLPLKFGERLSDPVSLYYSDYFSTPVCLAGIPSLSLPAGFSHNNLPVGFQFIGPRLSEELLYKVAYAYEQQTGYHNQTAEHAMKDQGLTV
jgi:aspartyl-tRNA(Asn)/glutamyl-tRNA(Gln) amidotransferase subunit A